MLISGINEINKYAMVSEINVLIFFSMLKYTKNIFLLTWNFMRFIENKIVQAEFNGTPSKMEKFVIKN